MASTIWFWQLTFPVMIILCSLVTEYKWTVLNLKCGSPSRWTAVTRLQHSSARDWRVAASAGRSLKLQHRLQHRHILFYLTHALCAPHQTWATRILNHIRVPRQKIVDSNIYSLICALTNWSRLVLISRMNSCKYQRVNTWAIGGEQYP